MKERKTGVITRRNFLKAIIGGGLLLGGGAYFGKGIWYRQAVNGMRNLGSDLNFQYLRQIIPADASSGRTIMWQSRWQPFQPQGGVPPSRAGENAVCSCQ